MGIAVGPGRGRATRRPALRASEGSALRYRDRVSRTQRAKEAGNVPGPKDALKIHAVDLFCGIGGLTQGLRLAGLDVDPSCRRIYEANHPDAQFVAADIRHTQFRDVAPRKTPRLRPP